MPLAGDCSRLHAANDRAVLVASSTRAYRHASDKCLFTPTTLVNYRAVLVSGSPAQASLPVLLNSVFGTAGVRVSKRAGRLFDLHMKVELVKVKKINAIKC